VQQVVVGGFDRARLARECVYRGGHSGGVLAGIGSGQCWLAPCFSCDGCA
jgi:hypothetical protein